MPVCMPYGSMFSYVICRIGSLEMLIAQISPHVKVICRIGSLEI